MKLEANIARSGIVSWCDRILYEGVSESGLE